MVQGDEHLLRSALFGPHIVFDDGVTAIKPALGAQTFKYPLGCVALLAWARFVLRKPTINGGDERIKLGSTDRSRPSITRRFRIRQHLCDTIPTDPKISGNLTPAQTFLKVSVTNLQIQIHGVYPQALPKTEGAKVDDF